MDRTNLSVSATYAKIDPRIEILLCPVCGSIPPPGECPPSCKMEEVLKEITDVPSLDETTDEADLPEMR